MRKHGSYFDAIVQVFENKPAGEFAVALGGLGTCGRWSRRKLRKNMTAMKSGGPWGPGTKGTRRGESLTGDRLQTQLPVSSVTGRGCGLQGRSGLGGNESHVQQRLQHDRGRVLIRKPGLKALRIGLPGPRPEGTIRLAGWRRLAQGRLRLLPSCRWCGTEEVPSLQMTDLWFES